MMASDSHSTAINSHPVVTDSHSAVIDEHSAAIAAVGVFYSYASRNVLDGLNLAVMPGEIYALLGGNGAGKSTLLSLFLGLSKPASGTVFVGDHDVAREPQKARELLAYVPESVALYEHLDAIENLRYFLALASASRDLDSIIAPALTAVGLAQSAWRHRLGGYSKGMRQKVAIAIALARKVPVLLLDEPTSGLDPRATLEFNQLLDNLRGQGVTTLMVTHDLLSAADIADRIGFLADGRVREEIATHDSGRFDVQALHQRYALVGATP